MGNRAFKRRCGWCGIRLPWNRLNLCADCGPNSHTRHPEGSRWREFTTQYGETVYKSSEFDPGEIYRPNRMHNA